MILERIFRPKSALDWLISTALLPISWIYAFGWTAYISIYALGIRKRKKFQIPIIGVGNLEVGGTGKTPIVIEIARLIIDQGQKVAISVNGYGSPARLDTQIAPLGSLEASEFGDETCLIRNALPEAGIIVGRNRVAAAELAEKNGFDVLILDDGFQHLPLARKVDLLVTDSTTKNRRCLPAGPMREPNWGANRADATLSYCGESDFPLSRKYSHFMQIATSEKFPISWIQNKEVSAMCGIGQPRQFFAALESLGAVISKKISVADHSAYIEVPTDGNWIVTEKDATKIEKNRKNIYVLAMEAKFEDEEKFRRWLEKNLLP